MLRSTLVLPAFAQQVEMPHEGDKLAEPPLPVLSGVHVCILVETTAIPQPVTPLLHVVHHDLWSLITGIHCLAQIVGGVVQQGLVDTDFGDPLCHNPNANPEQPKR